MAFARILRSSALMGGASVLVLVAAFFRIKAIALMVGPEGVGLAGTFVNFNAIWAMAAGWGLATVGVRTVASSNPSERAERIAAVRWLGIRLSWIGLLAMGLFFWPIGLWTFQDGERHILELGLSGLAVPLLVSAGMWGGLLQAGGHLRVLATTQVLSAFAGLVLGLPIIYVCHRAGYSFFGIALGILVATASPALLSWWAARKHCPAQRGTAVNLAFVRELLHLGGPLMIAGLLGLLSQYVARWVVLGEFGLEGAGYYQAAWAIASVLPGFVFAAMATDFFPRVAAAKDEVEARQMVEKQILAGLLLALPILAALLTMGHVSIHLLYSSTRFDPAVPLLTWMTWGVFFQVISWPMGLWQQARGSTRVVLAVQCLAQALLALLPLLLTSSFGLLGTAMAFAVGHLALLVMMLVTIRSMAKTWLSLQVWGYCVASALVLGLAQWGTAAVGGGYWGLVPTGLLTMTCAGIYYRTMRREAQAAPLQP